ncbi:MAG: (2Fe-2S) ferredoxin domain-containing protein [Planctomycetes bacterium]|nr:(2Fe-2S) ferredoxin domain-containing protein [Planctomycetota bacterium]
MSKFRQHIFVCENARDINDPRGCCSAKGSVAIREALKKECERRGLKGIVRVNKAGCLDQCHAGPTIVIYPEQTWYGGVKLEDVPKIVDALERGEVYHSLAIPDEHLTGRHGSKGNHGNTPGGF